MNVLDKAIALFISVLQKLYENKSRWEGATNSRAAIAMANSTLNYHLLSRHAVILGYSSETYPLSRACFERITRCIVFQLDEKLAKRFWAGKEIKQGEIRDIISEYFEKKVEGTYKEAKKQISNLYKELSSVTHPHLKTIRFRTVHTSNIADENTGINFTYGGESSDIVALMNIADCMTYVMFSLFMLEMLSKEILGTWGNVLERKIQSLFKEDDALLAKILKMQR